MDADDVQPEGAELVAEVSHPARFQEAVRLLRLGGAQGEDVRLAKGQANRDLLPSARGAGPVREGQEGGDSRPVRLVEPEPAFGERREGAIRIGLELRHVLQSLEVRDAHVVQGEHRVKGRDIRLKASSQRVRQFIPGVLGVGLDVLRGEVPPLPREGHDHADVFGQPG